MSTTRRIFVATAAWSIPSAASEQFATAGSGLQRYASVFDGVEVNSTFYRVHKDETIRRWAASVPPDFRFSVKMPKAITHVKCLSAHGEQLRAFIAQIGAFGTRLGPVLIQLPPKLAFDEKDAEAFFTDLRSIFQGRVACEPRHESWTSQESKALLAASRIARVVADPPVIVDQFEPDITGAMSYMRLHGSPRIYYSRYDEAFLKRVAKAILSGDAQESWFVFDNTASGAAIWNALELKKMLGEGACIGGVG
jgi:uncharacterized protein YecE (DUF72 family)